MKCCLVTSPTFNQKPAAIVATTSHENRDSLLHDQIRFSASPAHEIEGENPLLPSDSIPWQQLKLFERPTTCQHTKLSELGLLQMSSSKQFIAEVIKRTTAYCRIAWEIGNSLEKR
ncbi:hypothetical protein RB195_020886 [Necator americanus]|uniref:Uncharacterized protein n=1 Tax=Necator americanus TaxID=51031 RepID=A0ABR1CPE2_NECAM